MVYQDFKKPKPAFFAAKTFAEQLRGFRFLRRIPLPNTRDYVLVFERQGEERLAAWTSSAKKSFVVLKEIKGEFLETNYLGDKTQKRISGASGLALTLESSPKYFIPRSLTSGI